MAEDLGIWQSLNLILKFLNILAHLKFVMFFMVIFSSFKFDSQHMHIAI